MCIKIENSYRRKVLNDAKKIEQRLLTMETAGQAALVMHKSQCIGTDQTIVRMSLLTCPTTRRRCASDGWKIDKVDGLDGGEIANGTGSNRKLGKAKAP